MEESQHVGLSVILQSINDKIVYIKIIEYELTKDADTGQEDVMSEYLTSISNDYHELVFHNDLFQDTAFGSLPYSRSTKACLARCAKTLVKVAQVFENEKKELMIYSTRTENHRVSATGLESIREKRGAAVRHFVDCAFIGHYVCSLEGFDTVQSEENEAN